MNFTTADCKALLAADPQAEAFGANPKGWTRISKKSLPGGAKGSSAREFHDGAALWALVVEDGASLAVKGYANTQQRLASLGQALFPAGQETPATASAAQQKKKASKAAADARQISPVEDDGFARWTEPAIETDEAAVQEAEEILAGLMAVASGQSDGEEIEPLLLRAKKLIDDKKGLALANLHMFCLAIGDFWGDASPEYGLAITPISAGPRGLVDNQYLNAELIRLLPGEPDDCNGDGWWHVGACGRDPIELAREMVRRGFVFSPELQKNQEPDFLALLNPLFEADDLAASAFLERAKNKAAATAAAVAKAPKPSRRV